MPADRKPSLLMHACCAPCSTHPVRLMSETHAVVCFFYNPNIQPETEYRRRKAELVRLLSSWNIPLILGSGDSGPWWSVIRGHEDDPEGGERCLRCYRLRLEATAAEAEARGFDAFATTLTVSPHKNARAINGIGLDVAKKTGVPFFTAEFRKRNGFTIAGRISREEGLYRQSYCGCSFSRNGPRPS